MILNFELIRKLVGLNAIVFSNGEFKIWNVRMLFLPYKSLAFIQQSLEQKFGKKAVDFLYQIGRLQAYTGTRLIIKKFGIKNSKEEYNLFAQQTMMIGFGVSKLVRVNRAKKHLIIELESNPYMEEFTREYGKSNSPSDHYLRGLITGAVEALWGKGLFTIETRCIRQGREKCVFEVKPCEEKNKIEKVIKEQIPQNEGIYTELLEILKVKNLVKEKTEYSKVIFNFFKKKKISYDECGRLLILGTPGVSMQMDTAVVFLNKARNLFNDYGSQVFYESGNIAGREFLKFKPRSISQLNEVLKDLSFYGYGMFEVIREEKKRRFLVKVHNHVFAKHHEKIFGLTKEKVDPYICGVINGILEVYSGKSLITTEKKCYLQTHSEDCYFESTEVKE